MISVLEFIKKMKHYTEAELSRMPLAVWVEDTNQKISEVRSIRVTTLVRDQMVLDLQHDSGKLLRCCLLTVENVKAENLDRFEEGSIVK